MVDKKKISNVIEVKVREPWNKKQLTIIKLMGWTFYPSDHHNVKIINPLINGINVFLLSQEDFFNSCDL